MRCRERDRDGRGGSPRLLAMARWAARRGEAGRVRPLVLIVLALVAGALLLALSGGTSPPPAYAAMFIVTSSDDVDDGTCSLPPGHCSLREAINAANAFPDPDIINFNIPAGSDPGCNPGTGVCTISPGSQLPVIVYPVILDGYTQPGASPNTNPIQLGSNAVLKIVLDGTETVENGLIIVGGQSIVRGLVINNCGVGIRLVSANNVIKGNYIGTDASGTVDLGNYGGVFFTHVSSNNVIGGTTPEARNLISGNTWGIAFSAAEGSPAAWNRVEGNLIGTKANGAEALGNGIAVAIGDSWDDDVPNNVIGGTGPGAGNVISASDQYGVMIMGPGASGSVVKGNRIGTDVGGNLSLGNGLDGVLIAGASNNTVGGAGPNEGNIIAYNGRDGVRVEGAAATGNTISNNSIRYNVGKGIGLVDGGNTELPSPIVDGVGSAFGHTEPKCYPCTVEVFSDSENEGRVYHGSASTNDDETGTWTYGGPVTGPNVTATVTDASGNTSEFSEPRPVPPPPPPPQPVGFSIWRGGVSSKPLGPLDPADLLTRGGPPLVPCAALGLACNGQDDIDAVSLGNDFVHPPPDPAHPTDFLFISVKAGSQGKLGSGVRQEATCPTPEPGADEFRTDGLGDNVQVIDGDGVPCPGNPPLPLPFGLVEAPPLGDDVDVLANISAPLTPPLFSLDPLSPSLGINAWSAADILLPQQVYASAAQLGLLPPDDIDALCVRHAGAPIYEPGLDLVWFSLAPGSPTLDLGPDGVPGGVSWSAADILWAQPAGPPVRVLSADQIGLLPSDNVDAMKCYQGSPPPPPPGESSETGYDPGTEVDPESTNLGEPAKVEITVEVPPGTLATERVSLQLEQGPDSWPAASLPYGTQVGVAIVNVDACGTPVTVAGLAGPGAPVPLWTVDPGSVGPEVFANAGITPPEIPSIIVAFEVRGTDVKVWDQFGAEILLPFSLGVGNGFVLPSATGGTELILTTAGSTPLPPCIGAMTVHLVLFGTASPEHVRDNPAACGDNGGPGGGDPDGIDDCAGYYALAVRGASEVDPFAGGRYGDVGFHCIYFGGAGPVGSDNDGDCLENVATAQPGRPSESTSDDLIADRDGDGLVDGIEVLFGSHPEEVDSDGDGLSDYNEFLLRTTPNPEGDTDEDGKGDATDNCPRVENPLQEDLDKDGQGDACDLDDDGDYLTDIEELSVGIVQDTDPGEETFRCEFGGTSFGLLPDDPDYDNDGVLDGAECLLGSDPTNEVATCAESVPEICGDAIDNDCDGLTDEMPTDLGLEFVDGACSDLDDGDPDHDGLMDGEISWEYTAQTMCVRIGGPMPPEPPADPLLCDDEDMYGEPIFENDVDEDGLIGRLDSDSDNDGVPDGVEFKELGTSAVNPDSDSDGCAEGEELRSNQYLGGQRDPLDKWDFYDVPLPVGDPGTGAKNKSIDLDDTFGVLAKFGSHPSNPPGAPLYDAAYDRSAPAGGYPGPTPWLTEDPAIDGNGVQLDEVFWSLVSFGHSCFPPP